MAFEKSHTNPGPEGVGKSAQSPVNREQEILLSATSIDSDDDDMIYPDNHLDDDDRYYLFPGPNAD